MTEHAIVLRSPYQTHVGPILMKCWQCPRQDRTVVKCACGIQLCMHCRGDHFPAVRQEVRHRDGNPHNIDLANLELVEVEDSDG